MRTARRAACGVMGCVLALMAGAPAQAMSCVVTSTADVVFGDYDTRSSSALDTAGTISYACDDVAAADRITITLSRSEHGGFFPRKMARHAYRLEYNLFVDAARTRVWGDGTSSTSVYSVRPPDGAPVSVPIFARVPARQNVGVGSYGDTVTLTILY